MIDGGKVAGILLEQKGDRLIAGIGINLAFCPDPLALRQDAALPARCLRDVAPELAAALTPEMIVENLVNRLKNLDLKRFAGLWRAQSLSRLLWLHETVCMDVDGSTLVGVLAGLDERGGVLLVTHDGMKVCRRGAMRKA